MSRTIAVKLRARGWEGGVRVNAVPQPHRLSVLVYVLASARLRKPRVMFSSS